jgi:hypothetical protein
MRFCIPPNVKYERAHQILGELIPFDTPLSLHIKLAAPFASDGINKKEITRAFSRRLNSDQIESP